MRKIISVLFLAAIFFSCEDDKINIPTSVLIEESDIILVAEGETYYDRYYSTTNAVNVTVPAADRNWLGAKLENGYIVITAQTNSAIEGRNSSVILTAPELTKNIRITQSGLPTKQHKIIDGWADSQQAGEGIENSYNGDKGVSKLYHSDWGEKRPNGKFTLIYTLEDGASSFDLVKIWPRQSGTTERGGNGTWGRFEMWVLGDGTGVDESDPGETPLWEAKIGETDADGYKMVLARDLKQLKAPVEFAPAIVVDNPKKVKFLVDGSTSVGNFASLTEVEFHGKVDID